MFTLGVHGSVLAALPLPSDVFAWWCADDAQSSGGNLTTWTARIGGFILQPDTAQTCAVNASDAAYGGRKSVGTVGASSQILVTSAAMDFSDTDVVHAFLLGRSAAGAGGRVCLELNSTAAGQNGWGIQVTGDEQWFADSRTAAGGSNTYLSTSDSTQVAVVEHITDRSLATAETVVRVNGVAGDTRPLDNNTSGNFPSAILSLFGRDGVGFESGGTTRHIIIFKHRILSTPEAVHTRAFLQAN